MVPQTKSLTRYQKTWKDVHLDTKIYWILHASLYDSTIVIMQDTTIVEKVYFTQFDTDRKSRKYLLHNWTETPLNIFFCHFLFLKATKNLISSLWHLAEPTYKKTANYFYDHFPTN